MLLVKHRIRELYIHQLPTKHGILQWSGICSYSTKSVRMFGVSRKLVPDGGMEEREAKKRNKCDSPYIKNILMKF